MAFHFAGFSTPNGTIVPDEVFDLLAPELTEAELRVLLYIIRRTFGFKKNSDNISLKQMTDGIITREGRVLDRGTGLSKGGNARGIRGLIGKGIIITTRNRTAEAGDQATTYTLRFKGGEAGDRGGQGAEATGSPFPTEGSDFEDRNPAILVSPAPVSTKETGGCLPNEQGGVYQVDTQETVWQKTDFNHSNTRKQYTAKISNRQSIPQAQSTSIPGTFEAIGSVLGRFVQPVESPGVSTEEAREAIRAYLQDIAPKFNDQAPLESSASRAYHLYELANLPLGAFLSRLLEVASAVRERLAKVKKRANGSKVTMPYYFACLEDRLGLRQKSRGVSTVHQTDAASVSTPGAQDRRASISTLRTSSPRVEQGGKYPPSHTHSFARPVAQGGRTQSGQSSADALSASAAPS
jgi:hypothetical protein